MIEKTPKPSNSKFEVAKEVLITVEKPMLENRRFKRIKNIIAGTRYMKHGDVPEKKTDVR